VGGETNFFAIGSASRFCRELLKYPDYRKNPDRFLRWLTRVACTKHIDVVLPVEESSTLLLARRYQCLSGVVNLPPMEARCIAVGRDKLKIVRKAEQVGLPVPRTLSVPAGAELPRPPELPLPAVVKPRIGGGSEGVFFVKDEDQLRIAVELCRSRYGEPIVQEFIPSNEGELGYCALHNREGQRIAFFMHKRLRSYPVTGGPSTLRESFFDPEVEHLGDSLLRSLRWVGIAMVEFRRDARTGKPVLMEVNPRIWGSIALPIASGVDFPVLWVRLALGEPVKPLKRYQLGVQCRWLLPGDILHFIRNPERLKLRPSFFNFRDESLHFDLCSKVDPGPAILSFLLLSRPLKRLAARLKAK